MTYIEYKGRGLDALFEHQCTCLQDSTIRIEFLMKVMKMRLDFGEWNLCRAIFSNVWHLAKMLLAQLLF